MRLWRLCRSWFYILPKQFYTPRWRRQGNKLRTEDTVWSRMHFGFKQTQKLRWNASQTHWSNNAWRNCWIATVFYVRAICSTNISKMPDKLQMKVNWSCTKSQKRNLFVIIGFRNIQKLYTHILMLASSNIKWHLVGQNRGLWLQIPTCIVLKMKRTMKKKIQSKKKHLKLNRYLERTTQHKFYIDCSTLLNHRLHLETLFFSV